MSARKERKADPGDELSWTTVRLKRLGEVFLAATEKGVCVIDFPSERRRAPAALAAGWGESLGLEPVRAPGRLAPAIRALREWAGGSPPRRAVPVDLSRLRPFDGRVLGETARIPWGSTASYGEIARRIGRPGAARAVGGALGRNPVPILVPCHRVIAADGGLGGYTGSIERKKALLVIEGAR